MVAHEFMHQVLAGPSARVLIRLRLAHGVWLFCAAGELIGSHVGNESMLIRLQSSRCTLMDGKRKKTMQVTMDACQDALSRAA